MRTTRHAPIVERTVWTAAAIHDSPIGPLRLRATDLGLAACHVRGRSPGAERTPDPMTPAAGWLRRAAEQLDAYFSGDRQEFELALDLAGVPPAQARILTGLAKVVGYGHTISYGEVAARLGVTGDDDRFPAQLVGAALARNPLLVVLPCHRVVGAGGALTGFAAGLAAKRLLLDHESGQAALDLTNAPAGTST